MCAIAVGKSVGPMLEIMKHRGPDGMGIVKCGDLEFGMARLAIIDTHSEGLCPIEIDGRVLVFNGEIFNYIELRDELEKLGVRFRTESDSEVLLRAYIQWGFPFLDKLNGMFAFAIWDGDMVFCARDIAGEKPLYYSRGPFQLASEAKALNWKCLEFPPASYGIYKNGEFTIHRWWVLRKKMIERAPEDAERALETLLEDSVRLRTRSDVPYALYYSGGVDSSLIKTFHKFANHLTYEDVQYNQYDFLDVFEKISWHLDYPTSHFSPFALWKLAERARADGIKVVLTGDGADELFGGYVRYLPHTMNLEAQKRYPSYKRMFPSNGDANNLGWEEFNGNFRELLRNADRMSAAWGVENRSPFLDRRIIEFAFSLPPEMKISGLDTKKILNSILRRRNPKYKEIEKCGLFVTVNKWLGVSDLLDKTAYQGLQQKHHETFRRHTSIS